MTGLKTRPMKFTPSLAIAPARGVRIRCQALTSNSRPRCNLHVYFSTHILTSAFHMQVFLCILQLISFVELRPEDALGRNSCTAKRVPRSDNCQILRLKHEFKRRIAYRETGEVPRFLHACQQSGRKKKYNALPDLQRGASVKKGI